MHDNEQSYVRQVIPGYEKKLAEEAAALHHALTATDKEQVTDDY